MRKKMGFCYLTLAVDKENEKNVNLYKRLGFNTFVGQWGNSSSIVLKKDLRYSEVMRRHPYLEPMIMDFYGEARK